MIEITAFPWVPPFAQGLVRDFRVRWALEEAGLDYEARLLEPGDQDSAGHRALQPFGQVPTYQEDGLRLFESGAIVLHIAGKSEALAPADSQGQARMATWLFAALNSVEPSIENLATIDLFHADEEWAKLRRPGAVEDVRQRLDDLAGWLGDREYLEDRFTAADLLMTTVLRILRHTDLVAEFANLVEYKTRCEARPAFARAMADHMAPFSAHAPPERTPA